MRILQLTSDWKWTGPAEPLVHAVVGLRARGHEVDAAFPDAPPGHAGALGERADLARRRRREGGIDLVSARAQADHGVHQRLGRAGPLPVARELEDPHSWACRSSSQSFAYFMNT